jgi:adenosylcobinamide kinase/adenosylcobinamide-phosphate guanylyltransferase
MTDDTIMRQPVTGVTLLIGGARSGKSSLAVEIGRRHEGAVHVVATAEPFDDDLRERIDRHRAERPDWPTIEEPADLVAALASPPAEALVIVDCLTVWVANRIHRGQDDEAIVDGARGALDAARARIGPTVVITNEVGLGLHPETKLGRRYRDLLGRVNQIWAAGADRTLWLVAGRVVPLVDPWEQLS